MSSESKFASFLPHGGAGQIDLRLADFAALERKFEVAPQNLLGSIADNALAEALRQINVWLPPNTSVDFTKAYLDHDFPEKADQGITRSTVDSISRRINGGEGVEKREDRWESVIAIQNSGNFDNLCPFSVSHPNFGAT